MPDDLDKILRDMDRGKSAPAGGADEEALRRQREEKVSGFKLDIDLSADRTPPPAGKSGPMKRREAPVRQPDRGEEQPVQMLRTMAPPPPPAPVKEPAAPPPRANKKKKSRMERNFQTAWGWTMACLYVLFVLASSGILIYFGITGALDFIGFKSNPYEVEITLTEEQAKSVSSVAKVLKESGVIEQPLIFTIYCNFSDAGGFRAGQEFTLKTNMSYQSIINALRTVSRETVRITFQEGLTVEDYARKLEENEVCGYDEFMKALDTETFDYTFIKDIPTETDNPDYKYRHQMYEGFLFPDTYEFYKGSSGKTVADKIFREGFATSVPIDLRVQMKNGEIGSVYDTIILASIIQWESDQDHMSRISRVLHNRLYKKKSDVGDYLQCDSAYRYLDTFVKRGPDNKRQTDNTYYKYYDTYPDNRKGLPLSPICNPGLEAIQAALEPSTSSDYKDMYYFVTGADGVTRYAKTNAQHNSLISQHGKGTSSDASKEEEAE